MRRELDCVACVVQQVLNTARIATNDERKHEQVLREVMRYLHKADWNVTPAALSTKAYALVHKITNNPDPYKAIKEKQNKLALKLLPEIKRLLARSKDRLHTAGRLAVIGNIIDCGQGRIPDVIAELKADLKLPMAIDDFADFRRAFMRAKRIFYACDNAGEIVFDKVFMQEMKRERPDIELIACVRGSPILNDATLKDAQAVNLTEVAQVIDTGIAAIGMPLSLLPARVHRLLDSSDIIISKGQGNFETLDEITDGRVYFILRAKCMLISRKFNVPLHSIIFKHYKQSNSSKKTSHLIDRK
ncbi:MAG: ARMT1-like domain-containing protein [Candidatus Sumerlaeia bacterium]|nr:ARMT1-like domain-containing protein [Candidatus Sumerlaeia bacterium]